ncbi:MAG: WG repeat-containing protein, partial [Planktothrix sp.]
MGNKNFSPCSPVPLASPAPPQFQCDLSWRFSEGLAHEETANFSEGLAAVKIKQKWGYINQKSLINIPLQFDSANEFNQGLAGVRIKDKWGYINS